MESKSFYELDYIIELNEKRLEQYTLAYQKVLEKLTNIILIYSAVAIFLLPIVQDIFLSEITHWLLYVCFIVFAILFLISIGFTTRFVIPISVAYLEMPKKYYEEYRLAYEADIKDREEIEKLLKASYINELETALENNFSVFRRKSSFFYNALMYALLSVIPYLICLGFHISKREDKVQKIRIVSSEINSNLRYNIKAVSKDLIQNKATISNKVDTNSNSNTTTMTQLPGVNNSQVISSSPKLIKENAQYSSEKKG
ncbi:MAG: hypothetical protein M3139_13965 [Bacteroidota bacterium]|nr:hypothetical protein [Bacteroidota bacterium]